MRSRTSHQPSLRGAQTTVEYLLVISVLVIAAVGAARLFFPGFEEGLKAMTGDVKGMTEDGYIGGGR